MLMFEVTPRVRTESDTRILPSSGTDTSEVLLLQINCVARGNLRVLPKRIIQLSWLGPTELRHTQGAITTR